MSGSVRSFHGLWFTIQLQHNASRKQAETFSSSVAPNKIDEMMKDIEEKALRTEIEQFRAKLAQYEKGEN